MLVEELGATTQQAEAVAHKEWEAGYLWAEESYQGSQAAQWKREGSRPGSACSRRFRIPPIGTNEA